jgi:hypothetical protein
MFQLLFRLILGACCACIFGAWPASAQTAPSAADALDPSVRLVDDGIKLRQQGQDAAALELLQRAVTLAPGSVRARIHLATCFQALGDWVSADTHLRQALRHPADIYLERHRDAVEAAQRVIAEHIGMLEVAGGPEGAGVFLNGLPVGQLPLREPIRARVGDYVLEIKMADHYPTSRPVTIKSGTLVREAVQLVAAGRRVSKALAGTADGGSSLFVSEPAPAQAAPSAAASGWLRWALGGASGAAAVTAISALIVRNANAHEWNDDTRCLNVPGKTREQLCGGERHTAAVAQNVALVGGGASLLLGAGALFVGFMEHRNPELDPSHAGLLGACSLGLKGATCRGWF